MNKELSKKVVKHNKHQEIVFIGSKFFDIIEHISFWLHITALVLGILTVTGLASGFEHFTHYMEIATLVVISLIIAEFLFVPSLEKLIMRKMLKDLWGTNDIPTTIRFPTAVDPSKDFGTVKDYFESTQIEETSIEWIRVHPLARRRLAICQKSPVTNRKFKKYADENGDLNYYFVPIYIIVDLERKIIKFQGKINFVNDIDKNELPEMRLTFNFDLVNKKVTWSGIFPGMPAYGEWIWNKRIATELKNSSDKAKKQSKAVKKEFKGK